MADIDITRGTAFPATEASVDRIVAFLRAAYGWMCAGLAITAVTAWFVASSPSLLQAIRSGPLYLVLIVAQLGIVYVLSARVQQMTSTTAAMLFVAYSALTGVTLSFVLLAFTGESIATTFLVSGGAFAGLAIYGTTTKRSLSGLGQFLFMGLIGVVLASIVGIFWHSDALQFVLSIAGATLGAQICPRWSRPAADSRCTQAVAYCVGDGHRV